jgi:hypothetical protein
MLDGALDLPTVTRAAAEIIVVLSDKCASLPNGEAQVNRILRPGNSQVRRDQHIVSCLPQQLDKEARRNIVVQIRPHRRKIRA